MGWGLTKVCASYILAYKGAWGLSEFLILNASASYDALFNIGVDISLSEAEILYTNQIVVALQN